MMIRSAKMKLITPPKLIPPFHSTAASGTLPIEQTKVTTATAGPMIGPQTFASSGWPVRNSRCQKLSGIQAPAAPAINRPRTRSRKIAAHPITKLWLTAVNPAGLASPAGFTAVSHNFVMGWAAILRDLVLGLLIAGAAGAWIPDSFWQRLFLTGHPLLAKVWGPIIGPAVAVVTFVCSIGNVPLAAVLWNGGISFGGVISFIFADLIIIPLLLIYRKYYGTRMALFLFATFYVTMVAAGFVIELVFAPLGLVPTGARHANVGAAGISWNYTSFLNIAFLVLAAVLIVLSLIHIS